MCRTFIVLHGHSDTKPPSNNVCHRLHQHKSHFNSSWKRNFRSQKLNTEVQLDNQTNPIRSSENRTRLTHCATGVTVRSCSVTNMCEKPPDFVGLMRVVYLHHSLFYTFLSEFQKKPGLLRCIRDWWGELVVLDVFSYCTYLTGRPLHRVVRILSVE